MSEKEVMNNFKTLFEKYLTIESTLCEVKDMNCSVSIEEVEHFLKNLFLHRSEYR